MGLFGRGNWGSIEREWMREQQQRAQETIHALENRQLPPHVRQRISEQRRRELPWTSNLSVPEWLLTARYKFRPLGMVMGSCFSHIGISKADLRGSWGSGEFTIISRVIRDSRTKALERMALEAKELGANAVVGVRVDSRTPGYFGHDTEFTAFGTAIAVDGLKPANEPLLCTVSAQELAKLLAQGTVPLNLALGVSAYYQYTDWRDKMRESSWFNQELPTMTDAVYTARYNAMSDMLRDAGQVGGTGVLAHDTKMKVYEVEVERGEGDDRTDHILEVVSTGTIVASEKRPLPVRIKPVLSLNDKYRSLAFDPTGNER